MKRLIDIVAAVVLLVLTSPVWLVAGLAVVLQDGGSPFFRQPRVGLDGRPFRLWKFRSMVKNAAALGGYATNEGDPRITRVGAFLRKTSIDELPQFLNVLAGDMGLVGPRPDTPMQEGNYPPEVWEKRLSVVPGITGYAQVMLKGGFSDARREVLDLEYIDRQSLKLDFWIMWQTVMIVARRRNR